MSSVAPMTTVAPPIPVRNAPTCFTSPGTPAHHSIACFRVIVDRLPAVYWTSLRRVSLHIRQAARSARQRELGPARCAILAVLVRDQEPVAAGPEHHRVCIERRFDPAPVEIDLDPVAAAERSRQ